MSTFELMECYFRYGSKQRAVVRQFSGSMQKVLTLLLTVLIFKATNAQTALIKDSNGYCKIRQSANSKSKVIDTLHNDRIVFIFSDAAEGEWFPVDYYKGNRNSSDQTRSGYIHKSRIKFLTNLTKFRQVTLNIVR